MNMLFRATNSKKQAITDSIVACMEENAELSKESAAFVSNWILTGPEEKTKAYYDIWNMVLDHYLPQERPVLFRSCERISFKPIQSFTGKMAAANRFSKGHKGHLLICDTNEYMEYLNCEHNRYIRNFFPVYELIRKDMSGMNPHFSEKFYQNYKDEDEYIVRVDYSHIYDLKWNR